MTTLIFSFTLHKKRLILNDKYCMIYPVCVTSSSAGVICDIENHHFIQNEIAFTRGDRALMWSTYGNVKMILL